MKTLGVRLFASIVFSKEELDLSCTNVNQLERPFFFLFERIDLFMKHLCFKETQRTMKIIPPQPPFNKGGMGGFSGERKLSWTYG
jgi:hypothetical protein